MALLDNENLADALEEQELHEIGKQVCETYQNDRKSRHEWESMVEESLRFAKQMSDPKDFPWPECANVIFPLVTMAVITFASRVYPELIRDNKVVKFTSLGTDPTNEKSSRAERLSAHMSYQLLIKSDLWEPDTDKLLHILPLVGVCFKKVYYDKLDKLSKSELCNPADVVINNNAASLEKSRSITHRYFLSKNEIIERQRAALFRDIDLFHNVPIPSGDIWNTTLDSPDSSRSHNENLIEHEILEQHTFLDLDKDGYDEPYIVTVHAGSGEVLCIYPRFNFDTTEGLPGSVTVDTESGDIVKIYPHQHFIDFHFIPSPDGSFYSIGYGHLLFPLNKAVNTLINQLTDAGTLSNTKGGLISRQLKMRGGAVRFNMAEFIPVDPGSSGKLSDSVMPFDFGEPSQVLFQLLGLLLQAGKEIASINDVLTGQALPQNSPATSVYEIANQGLKVFNSIAKRLYRSLKKEFDVLYKLNRTYFDSQEYFLFQDMQVQITGEDYKDDGMDVAPVADPNLGSDSERGHRAQALAGLLQNQLIAPSLNVPAVLQEIMRSLRIPEDQIPQFVPPPQPPQPDPATLLDQQKMQWEKEKFQLQTQLEFMKLQTDAQDKKLRAVLEQQKLTLKAGETDDKQRKMQAEASLRTTQAKIGAYEAQTHRMQAAAALIEAKKPDDNKE